MRVGENNRKDGQSTTIFSKTERKTNMNTSLIGTTKKAVARTNGCGKVLPVFLLYSF